MQLRYLKSAALLDDCRRALDLLEKTPEGDRQLLRIYWTFCLVTLERVANVLRDVDSTTYPKVGEKWSARYQELKGLLKVYKGKPHSECPQDYLIFWRFVHDERNAAAHTDGVPEFPSWTAIGSNLNFGLGDSYLPFPDIEKMGDLDCRDWISDAIDWWQNELNELVK